ncbi:MULTISPECIES: type IV pilus biogenesis/stability protein PilW [Erwinia]|uniref:type IV pilus biogenesis/stability protein PilW n=1 Tax=Erwinia TaxID=551 RepID=UPI000689ACEF|nr:MULTISPECIES: type IV pilus biogenesis/stability protein PilW [Erwinia]
MGKGIPACLLAVLLTGCAMPHPHSELAQTRLQLGLEYLAVNDLAAAQRNLRQAVALAPEDYRAHLAIARYHQQALDEKNAMRAYQTALKLAPQNGSVFNNYGAFLCRLRQYETARHYFSKAAELSGNISRADAAENAGYCYLAQGEWQQAAASFDEAVMQVPDKGLALLAEAERRIDKRERDASRLLLDVYQRSFAASAQSLWLEIRFAALAQQPEGIASAGDELARNFPQSKQHLHFLANEY